MTLGIKDYSITVICHYAECSDIVIIMLNVIMLSVVMLNVIILSVVIHSVMAPMV
jgi:hypothetical protein